MKRFLILFITRRWIRKAQLSWSDIPNDRMFNTAGFQSAVRDDLGVLPPSEFAQFLIKRAGGRVLSGGSHWLY